MGPPNGPRSSGRCRRCGRVERFRNSPPNDEQHGPRASHRRRDAGLWSGEWSMAQPPTSSPGGESDRVLRPGDGDPALEDRIRWIADQLRALEVATATLRQQLQRLMREGYDYPQRVGHLLATRPLALPKVTPVATARTEALAAALRKRGQSKLRGALPPARWAAVGAVVLSGTVAAVWFLVVPGGAPRSDGATEQPSPRSAVTDDSPRPGAVPPALIAPSEAGLFDRGRDGHLLRRACPSSRPGPLPGDRGPFAHRGDCHRGA